MVLIPLDILEAIGAGIGANIATVILSYFYREKKIGVEIRELLRKSIKNKLKEKNESYALNMINGLSEEPWNDSQIEFLVNLLTHYIKDDDKWAIQINEYNIKYQNALESALESHNKIKDKFVEGNVRLILGNIYFYQNKLSDAAVMYESSYVLFIELDDPHGIGKNLLNLGNLQVRLGKYDKADNYFKQSLLIFRDSCDENATADVLKNIANLNRLKGLLDEAIATYNESLKLSKSDLYTDAKINLNIANIYFEKKELEKARLIYEKEIPNLKRINDKYSLRQGLINLATIYFCSEMWEQSINYYKEYLFLNEKPKDSLDLGNIALNLGNCYYKINDIKNALKSFEAAKSIFQRTKSIHSEGLAIWGLAYTYLLEKDKNECKKNLMVAVSKLRSDSCEFKSATELLKLLT